MTPINIAMMVLIPVSLMVVLGLVLLSGSISPLWRRRTEQTLLVVFCPLMILFWAWRAVDAGLGQNWVSAVVAAALCLGTAFVGIKTACKSQRADGNGT